MESWSLGGLVVLALVDSTSFGTMLIPVWMMLAPRLRVSRVLLFLGAVAGFYFVVGLALLAGLDVLSDLASSAGEVRAVVVAQLVVGVALFVWSFRLERAADGPSPRVQRWHERLTGEGLTVRTTLALAMTATVLEVATMLPYLAASGLISASDLSAGLQVLVLAAYVLVMVLPALVTLTVRVLARRLVEPLLVRLSAWMTERSGSAVSWVVGIVGFLLAADALQRL